MNGEKRRTEIIGILTDTDRPVSGGNLAEKFNISRQVIVQDIALLRAQGYDILSANRGYMIQKIWRLQAGETNCQEEYLR